MKIRRSISRCCPNPACCLNRQFGKGNIISHSFYITTQGRRRRYRLRECGKTFSSAHGSPYYRLHKSRSLFDETIPMCVHGIAISAMVRIKKMAWRTVSRWIELAAAFAEQSTIGG
jgi:transposase-like protein